MEPDGFVAGGAVGLESGSGRSPRLPAVGTEVGRTRPLPSRAPGPGERGGRME